ncbi:MAG: hypothetical protein JXQ73_24840 [Phycisphaerae bacterium]|nr:hypothetical protein [Phycisphaerae bacterium]
MAGIEKASDVLSTQPRCTSRRWRRILTLVASGTSGVLVFAFSGDWLCSAIGAGMLTGLIVVTIDVPLCRITTRRGWNVTRVRRLEIGWALLVIAVVFMYFRVDPEGLFERVFGVRPPEGIRNLQVERHFQGGPGDAAILLRFQADRSTLERLLANKAFGDCQDWLNELLELYPDPQERWDQIFQPAMLTFASSCWHKTPTISRPVLYRWDDFAKTGTRVILLWDAASESAYVVWLLG